jgi:5-(carboxyamino)imidazole ribonucleotide synthase
VLHIAQHRAREKNFLQKNQFPVVPFHVVRNLAEAEKAVSDLGTPCVLKTAGFGYDGKGQKKIQTPSDLVGAIGATEGEWVVEQWQDFEKEVSVLVARNAAGESADWGVVENAHHNHILDTSSVPATLSRDSSQEAIGLAHGIAQSLDLVGLLCIEFFVLKDGKVRVNEMAPRPHNSGHWTIEGAVTSQFEQQLRAILGLHLGSTEILRPTAMANVLGEAWANGEPDWAAVLGDSDVKWHSYGKKEPRPGRKMGHLTASAETTEKAIAYVRHARQKLMRKK